MNALVVALAVCGAVACCWLYRIVTAPRTPTSDQPDDIGITPATDTQPAILWARYGATTRFSPVRGTQLPTTPEEPQP
ncbi:hypothetical protein RMN57_13085 [Kitasatospora sp. CM 4170]|uniref:Secreted protein n=1 Tax=Kitasatospora aburaviensis TaxID=67265 RepID=A0ABW1F5C8_9ACTN|nr:hypothetical protein [Kitasatospora sp. CM 4170]WNM45588.1 hypothetical protein RMN57_13085 [Kitasatospora sp. CM 4170]